MSSHLQYYEFFAGGGMVRQALDNNWECIFANDISEEKARSYRENWGGSELVVGDISALKSDDLPRRADLAWASFPCQDLSVAGSGAGLKGARSGTFWAFNHLLTALRSGGRLPRSVILENVNGFLTSHQGNDFKQVVEALSAHGYRVGALVMDAAKFIPQSRPRVFVIAADPSLDVTAHSNKDPCEEWTNSALRRAYDGLSDDLKANWVWWNVPSPAKRTIELIDLIETSPNSVGWDTPEETQRILGMMAPIHSDKVDCAKRAGIPKVGTLYKRTRKLPDGRRMQRAEVRFDGIAGCLRTPGGGSSRQRILLVNGDSVRSRLLSTRETARLMGLPDSYVLPDKYNAAYHLTGDGVAVPVVRHISQRLLESLFSSVQAENIAA